MNKGRKIVVCARVGGTNITPILAAHFAKRNTKFGGGGKRGRAKIPSPQPLSFLPARAFWFCARSAQLFRVLLKKCSNFVQKTPHELLMPKGIKSLFRGVLRTHCLIKIIKDWVQMLNLQMRREKRFTSLNTTSSANNIFYGSTRLTTSEKLNLQKTLYALFLVCLS